MNKKELVEKVSEKTDLTKKEVRDTIDATMEVVTDTLGNGERVLLVGFGTFQTVEKKARRGVNPQTGKKINIPAKKVAKFKPGGALKDAVS